MLPPSLFQATVLTALLQITALLSSLCQTGKALSNINLFSLQEGHPDSSVWPLKHCLTAFALLLHAHYGNGSVLPHTHTDLFLGLLDTLNSLWSQSLWHIPPAPKVLLPIVSMTLPLIELLPLNTIHVKASTSQVNGYSHLPVSVTLWHTTVSDFPR